MAREFKRVVGKSDRAYRKSSASNAKYQEKLAINNDAYAEGRGRDIPHKWVLYNEAARQWLNAGRPDKAADDYRKAAKELYAMNERDGRGTGSADRFIKKAERLEKTIKGTKYLSGKGRTGQESWAHERHYGHGKDVAGKTMALLSGIFIILSGVFSTASLTGNAIIQNMSSIDANVTGLGFFLIGIVLALAYIKGRR